MRKFTVYGPGMKNHPAMLEVSDDEGHLHWVSDDDIGYAAQELLELPFLDGLGIRPAWMTHEVAHRAQAIDPDVDPYDDFEVLESEDGLGATIVRISERRTR